MRQSTKIVSTTVLLLAVSGFAWIVYRSAVGPDRKANEICIDGLGCYDGPNSRPLPNSEQIPLWLLDAGCSSPACSGAAPIRSPNR